jgi:6-phosphofructokinase 1
MKKIAVLTSGGDAPGMNPAIRSVVRTAIYHNLEVVGVRHGYQGLIEKDFFNMDRGSVGDIIQRGGTILLSARCEEFKTEAGRKKAYENMREEDIDALVVIGGDGSLKGVQKINAESEIKAVGIPGTIDNDLSCTDYTIGVDTAMNTILDAINKIRDTATSHERTFVIECMGRDSGYLALMAGLAGGAEYILVPEIDFTPQEVCDKITQGFKRGKLHSLILIAEGVKAPFADLDEYNGSPGLAMGDLIRDRTDMETRVTILGHLQRGGSPTATDRIIASRMGYKAVDLLINGEKNKMVSFKNNSISFCNIEDAIVEKESLNMEIFKLAKILSM